VFGVLAVALVIAALPSLVALRGAGLHYRRALIRSLVIGGAAYALFIGWGVLGWYALNAGGPSRAAYRDLTLVAFGAVTALFPFALRGYCRMLADAHRRDAEPAVAG
jgi:hypothetical protein